MRTHSYPAWFYGPGGVSQLFESEAEVPANWHDHPAKAVTAPKTGSAPLPPVTDPIPPEQRGSAPVVAENNATAPATGGGNVERATADVSNTLDADGWPWSADLHAASQSQTKAGLWRMKVGASRPAPKPGFPKPVLDL